MFILMCVEFSQAVAMGDLMLTVKQRAAINVARENGVTQVGTEVVSDKVKMNGFYFNNRDNKEQATIWINGKLMGGQGMAGIQLKKVNERDKTVSMTLDKTGSVIPMKAGQTLLFNDGRIIEAFEE
jgi:hypothetical protein